MNNTDNAINTVTEKREMLLKLSSFRKGKAVVGIRPYIALNNHFKVRHFVGISVLPQKNYDSIQLFWKGLV